MLHKKCTWIILSAIAGSIFGLVAYFVYVDTKQDTQEIYHEAMSSYIEKNINSNSAKSIDKRKIYESLCRQEKSLCNKIYYRGEYDPQDKEGYGIVTIYFIRAINNIIGSKKLSNAIEKVDISFESDVRRGYSTHRSLFLHTPGIPYKEYMMVLIHELGHIIDLGLLEGKSKKTNEYFTEFGEKVFARDDISLQYYALSRDSEKQRKNLETRESFCSIYGMTNPFEDFAECFQLYINHNQYFRTLVQDNIVLAKKYAFMHKLLQGKYLYKMLQNIEYKNNTHYRYRDTTRMN